MAKYSTVLFDADATLFDFKRSEHDAVLDCLLFAGLPTSEDIISKYSEINDSYWKKLERGEVTKPELFIQRWQTLLEICGFDFDAKLIADKYPEKLAEHSYLIDGAEDICSKLSSRAELYIVTNGFAYVQHGRFDKSPIRKFFKDMFISEELGYEKPSLEFFREIEKKLPNYDKNKTIIIGDSLTSDISGGINAGIDTCWFNPQKKPCPDNLNITYIINSLDELEEIVI